MSGFVEIKTSDGGLLQAVRVLLGDILAMDDIGAVMTPARTPGSAIMPALISDPERLGSADPLSPEFPVNAAAILSSLTRKPIGKKILAVLRPCEIRAFIELEKLNQGSSDDLVILGLDCPGSISVKNHSAERLPSGDAFTLDFVSGAMAGNPPASGLELAAACNCCDNPIPEGADILAGLYGVDIENRLLVKGTTPKGSELIGRLGLPKTAEPPERGSIISALAEARAAKRDAMFTSVQESAGSLEKLSAWFASCVNCRNCRVACPICYCRECVFNTDVFDQEPAQYLDLSRRRGVLRLPADTLFYHLTRLTHVSLSCVGCGQCSNACPQGIPVFELFRYTAFRTQKAFGYQPGLNRLEKPPLACFEVDEFPETTDWTA